MKKLSWGLWLCVFATLVMVVTQGYFAFVFHPEYARAGNAASSQLFDPDAYLAFLKSKPGIVLNVLWIVPCIGAAFMFLTAQMPGGRGDEN